MEWADQACVRPRAVPLGPCHANANAHANGGIRGPYHEVQASAHGCLRPDAVSASMRTHALSAPLRTDAVPASV